MTGSIDPQGLYGWRGQEGSRSGFDVPLVEMQARSYDPTIGRFLQADALPIASLTTQGMNRYIYCENDPVNFSDPLGESFWSNLGGALLIVGGLGLMAIAIVEFSGFSLASGGVAALIALALFVSLWFAGLAMLLQGFAMLDSFKGQRCQLKQAAGLAAAIASLTNLGKLASAKTLVERMKTLIKSLGGFVYSAWAAFSG